MKTILVSVDALRADHLAQYGYHRDTMPVLDRLGEEATKFDAVFSNGPHTVRSIPSMLTSLYLVTDLKNERTVGSILSDAGVETAAFHSNTALDVAYSGVLGFDTYRDYMDELNWEERHHSLLNGLRAWLRNGIAATVERSPLSKESVARVYESLPYSPLDMGHEVTIYVDAERVTSDVVEWLEVNAGEDFFLWVHYMDPHRPYGVGLTDPAFASRPLDEAEVLDLVSRANTDPESVDEAERQRLVDLYDSEIRYTSTQVRRLFDALERLGIWDEMSVLFTADHGEEFHDHGMYDHGNRPYDELIRVPLYVKAPDVPAGTVDEQRELVDVLPTVCQFHGVPVEHDVDGEALFEGEPRTVVSTGSIRDDDSAVAVRTDGYKYIHVADNDPELYDLADDPAEQQSIHEASPGRCESMRGRIPAGLLERVGGIALTEQRETNDEQVQKRLEGLGYLE